MKRRLLTYLLHAAVLVGVGVGAARYLSGEAFLGALERFSWFYAPLLLGLSLLHVAVKGWRFALFLQPLTEVSRATVFRAYLAGEAMTLLPGGVAARAGLLAQVGVSVSKSSVPILFSSLFDQAAFLLGLLLCALWFEGARRPLVWILGALALLGLLMSVPTVRRWSLRTATRLMNLLGVGSYWQNFLSYLGDVAKGRVLVPSALLTLLALFIYLLGLDLSVRGVGGAAPYPTLLVAFILPTMLGRLSALPGGVGVTEAGMVGLLTAATTLSVAEAAAATAVFRAAMVLFSAAFGGLFYFLGWRGR